MENKKNDELKPLEFIGALALLALFIFIVGCFLRYIDGKDDKIQSLETSVDSLRKFIKTDVNIKVLLLSDSLKKESKEKEFYKAESNYRLHQLIMQEGPLRNTEEFHGPCKLYTYKEIKDSFEVVENRYHQLLWKR